MEKCDVNVGDAFHYVEHGVISYTFVVISIVSKNMYRVTANVLMLSVPQDRSFRVRSGELTDWNFDSLDTEWVKCLYRAVRVEK